MEKNDSKGAQKAKFNSQEYLPCRTNTRDKARKDRVLSKYAVLRYFQKQISYKWCFK